MDLLSASSLRTTSVPGRKRNSGGRVHSDNLELASGDVLGNRIRDWVEAQVDTQLEATMREVRVVADAQARLLGVIEGISDEVAKLRREAAENVGASLSTSLDGHTRSEIIASVEKVIATVADLQRNALAERDDFGAVPAHLSRHDAELAELIRRNSDLAARHAGTHAEVQRLRSGENELLLRFAKYEGELNDIRRSHGEVLSMHNAALGTEGGVVVKLAQHDAQIASLWQRTDETAARHEAAERDLQIVPQLAARLEHHEANAASLMQMATNTEQHEGLASDVQQLTLRLNHQEGDLTSVRQVTDQLAAQLERHEAKTSERLGCMEGDAAELRRLGGIVDGCNRELASLKPLCSKIGGLESSMAALQQLPARVEKHHEDLAELRGLTVQISNHDSQLVEMQNLASWLHQHEATIASVGTLADQLQQHANDIAAVRDTAEQIQNDNTSVTASMQQLAEQCSRVTGELSAIKDHGGWLARHDAEITTLHKRCDDTQASPVAAESLEQIQKELSDMECQIQESAQKYEASCGDLYRLIGDSSKRDTALNDMQRLHDDVERHESAIAHLQRVGQQLQLNADREQEGQQPLTKRMEAWQSRVREEFAAQQQHLVAELRVELRSNLQSHANAIKAIEEQVSAMDEQLWQTDKRLGTRLNELAHGPFAAAMARASEVVSSTSLSMDHVSEVDTPRGGTSRISPRSSQRPKGSDMAATGQPCTDAADSPLLMCCSVDEDRDKNVAPAGQHDKEHDEGSVAGGSPIKMQSPGPSPSPPSFLKLRAAERASTAAANRATSDPGHQHGSEPGFVVASEAAAAFAEAFRQEYLDAGLKSGPPGTHDADRLACARDLRPVLRAQSMTETGDNGAVWSADDEDATQPEDVHSGQRLRGSLNAAATAAEALAEAVQRERRGVENLRPFVCPNDVDDEGSTTKDDAETSSSGGTSPEQQQDSARPVSIGSGRCFPGLTAHSRTDSVTIDDLGFRPLRTFGVSPIASFRAAGDKLMEEAELSGASTGAATGPCVAANAG